ncbi:glycosyltransferase family 4 protein [Thomasclavelia spiroformis]|uniref:glycosyltransferase family 4 protein n=1 Tax=Thomasclavelia spiroformis TaxID=29348 RepID=UPI0026DCC471|nr:glycosyltransferase family 4 protein [Thomasclavelia spiroformis]
MKYIYISCYLPEKYLKKYVQMKKVNLAAQKYHRLMIEGLINNNTNISCISLIPINRLNCDKKIIVCDQYDDGRYIVPTMINLPVLKQISMLISCMNILLKESRKNKINIILDGLNITAGISAISLRKLIKAKCLAIITDMPNCLADNSVQMIRKFNQYVLKKFDYYVFLTKYMNNQIHAPKNRFVVLEGQIDTSGQDTNFIKHKERKIILYSGSIHVIYGIKNLVEGFIDASLEDCELHIYGDGDYANELREIANNLKRIKYFGVVSNDVIIEKQKEAYLLVNPRPVGNEYTLYSFPSKNLEYMNSGTAMITTKLPGIPEEYMKYIFLFPDDSVDGIKKGLEKVINMPRYSVESMGKEAQMFVRKEKNKENQAMKMIALFDKKDWLVR